MTMADIRLTHRGLGLWVERTSYWEILFPRADADVVFKKGYVLSPHYPALYVPTFANGKKQYVVHDLSSHWLDLTNAATPTAKATLKNDFMLALKTDASSPAHQSDAYTKAANVLGAVRMPAGTVSPKGGGRYGPVEIGTTTGLWLSYAVVWKALANEITEPNGNKYVELTVSPRDGGKGNPYPIQLRPDPLTGNYELILENLSLSDMNSNKEVTGTSDPDFAAHYFIAPPLALSGGGAADWDIPTYKELPELTPSIMSGVPVGVFLIPEHLCPSCYLE